MGREFHPERFRHRLQAVLAGKGIFAVHVKELRIIKAEAEGRQLIAPRFQIEILDVVERRMTADDGVLPFQQFADTRIDGGKGGVFFEILIFVGQNDPLPALSVGQTELAPRIDEDVLPLGHVELFVRDDVSERADLGDVPEYAGAFDVEKYVFHSVPARRRALAPSAR